METIRKYLPSRHQLTYLLVIIVMVVTITATATGRGAGGEEREMIEQEPTEAQDATRAILEWLEAMEQKVDEVSQTVSELQSRIEVVEFKADPDYPLSVELQEYAYYTAMAYGVPYEHVRKIIWSESGCQDVGAVMDTNGLYSTGYMQVNAINWPRLEEMGVDVHTDEGSILAGIIIYAELRERYGAELAPVAYQCGPGRMQQKGIASTAYSRYILDDGRHWSENL